jgi:polyisoprenoid-binding protein YceI
LGRITTKQLAVDHGDSADARALNFFCTIRCNEYRGNASNQNEAKGANTMTTATTPQTAVTPWAIDPAHSVAEFKVKHMMISNVKGQFSGLSGTLDATKET